jgi:hypothetical protein
VFVCCCVCLCVYVFVCVCVSVSVSVSVCWGCSISAAVGPCISRPLAPSLSLSLCLCVLGLCLYVWSVCAWREEKFFAYEPVSVFVCKCMFMRVV